MRWSAIMLQPCLVWPEEFYASSGTAGFSHHFNLNKEQGLLVINSMFLIIHLQLLLNINDFMFL
jgi:hypothetical protein